jgi:hypothetical protein
MRNVFSAATGVTNGAVLKIGRQLLLPGSKQGLVEKILAPGKYVVVMQDGQKITAQGSRSLRVGHQVQVLRRVDLLSKTKDGLKSNASSLKEPGLHWKAFVPLGFGGKKAGALLKVYVEKNDEAFWGKRSPAIYFVFTVRTDKQGELQWSIYLKGHQLAVQVFSGTDEKRDDLKLLMDSVENNLKGLGFQLLTPTIYLKSPFRVPEGFRLNIKG